MVQKKAVVIGAGFGGLAGAAYLAKAGYDVTVLEKTEQAGGRARVWESDGFRFDMGPSWYMMPEVFQKFFADFGHKESDFYELQRLDPSYRVFFGPKDVMDLYSDLEKNIALYESIEPGAGEQLRKYLAQAEYQYDVSMRSFIYKNFTKLRDFFNWQLLFEGRKLHVFESLDRFTKRFFKNDRLRKVLQYSMVFLGGAPNNTPALYSVINHADFNLGIWYPMGGFGEFVKGMQKVGEEQGVKFRFNTAATGVRFDEHGRINAITTNGEDFPCDVVLANGDYHHVEMNLLPKSKQSYSPRYWDKRVVAPSGFILFLGIKKRLPQLSHHNLILDNDWMRHFNDIFDHPAWPEHPSYYICCPSVTDATVAPAGMENLFVLVPVASGLEDTPEHRAEYEQKILTHMEDILGEKFIDDIVVRRSYSLADFQSDYNAFRGTALGLSHTLLQTAVFRPRMQSRKVPNLFYAGQFTQPGIGVPMAVISGQIAVETITAQETKI